MNPNFRNFALWVVIALLLIALFNLFQSPSERPSSNELAYTDLLAQVEQGRVSSVTISGRQLTGKLDNGQTFETYLPDDPNLIEKLESRGVTIVARPPADNVPSLLGVLVSWFPMLLLIGVWIFFMRQMQGAGGKAMGFGKSKAKLLTEAHGRVVFDDVAGVDASSPLGRSGPADTVPRVVA